MEKNRRPLKKRIKEKKVKASFICALIISIFTFINGSGYYTILIFIVSFLVIAWAAFYYRKVTDRKKWMAKHQSFVTCNGVFDILLIGDSLTAKWHKDVWKRFFAEYKTANFGINGDFTHDVLWRIENGALKNIQPKLIILLCGANNIGLSETPESIVASIEQIVNAIQQRRSELKILLLGIFPIEEKPTSQKRSKIKVVNNLLSSLHYEKNVFFLDIGSCFLDEAGNIHRTIMPDYLHLSKQGYILFAEAIKNKVDDLLESTEFRMAGNI